MVLIFHDELPRPNEKGRNEEGGVEKAGDWKRKIQEEFFAFAPSGRRVCWWSTVRFSGKRISTHPPTHASLSNRMKSQRRSSFIHRSSCAARLLLIKQWQTPFDRSWRKFHLGDTDDGCQVQPGGKVGLHFTSHRFVSPRANSNKGPSSYVLQRAPFDNGAADAPLLTCQRRQDFSFGRGKIIRIISLKWNPRVWAR